MSVPPPSPSQSDTTGFGQALTASPAEQQRFNLMFTSLMYWYGECQTMAKVDTVKTEIIKIYAAETHIQAGNATDLKAALAQQDNVVDQQALDLRLKDEELTKTKSQLKWAKATRWLIGGCSLALGAFVGYGVGQLVP